MQLNQVPLGLGPDVLALQESRGTQPGAGDSQQATTLLQTKPTTEIFLESEGEFYRRKKDSVVVRHVSGDRVVAVVEIISPGNKANRHAFATFVEKACELLERRIHLLIVDPFPPGPRDPRGVHSAIWENFEEIPSELLPTKPLILASYECDWTTRAYLESISVSDALPDMPLFLEPNGHITVPLQATYDTAFSVLPRRWKESL